MTADAWLPILVLALAAEAALGLGYRIYRLAKGGPLADVIGQAILAIVLAALALGAAQGAGWARWGALAFGLSFALLVMPVWTLAVLIPLRPGPIDYAFTAVYWLGLGVVVVAAILV